MLTSFSPRLPSRPAHATAALAASVVLALALAGTQATAAGPEPVEIRDGDLNLKAIVYRPEGTGPFAAVIGMHDCAGLRNAGGNIASNTIREWATASPALHRTVSACTVSRKLWRFRAGSATSAPRGCVPFGPTASGSPTPMRRDAGWSSSPT